MKNISLIFNIVLTIAVATLFVLHFTGKSEISSGSSNNEDLTITASKGDIVYLQIDSLVNNYDMFNDLRSELESKYQIVQNDISKRARALENDIKDFEDRARRGLITRSQVETQQNQLLGREQDLQNYSQQKQMEMAEDESVLYNKVMDAISTYLKNYNTEHGFALILTTSPATNVVIEGNKNLDITKDIIKGLNEEYIKTRTSRKK